MINLFTQFAASISPLTPIEVAAIANVATTCTIPKRAHLIEAGQVANQLAFFTSGYFRFYHFNHLGEEITSDFYFAPNVVSSYTSLITQQKSKVYVQAMQNMDLLIIMRADLEKLYDQYPRIERLGRKLAEQVAITSENHLFSLLNYTAAERYEQLRLHHPEFIRQIPVQYLASYLGITRETLSRIRKKG